MKERILLADAKALADELVRLIGPRCKRLMIGGSIRRGRPDPGDIEILYEPCFEKTGEDLFGDPVTHNATFAHLNLLKADGVLSDRLDVNGRPAWGERYQRGTFNDFSVDLYANMDPNQWGIHMAIRTGGEEFSKALVTSRLEGGLLPPGCRIGSGWQFFDGVRGKIEVPDEEQLFRLLEIDPIAPENRRWPL